ncbi:beta-ketoacyl synthase domain-containing protein [Thelonectria olida]|uniref:Beta-ketoacyl synthase domain-containing protein n=1 Tax=Thelonectria olida TaxID=1576542 RepID=A0A9P8VVX8_9HYPO|nr:beta-ketoacyl synthase domain-containing protein [Thelonectria olida]
MVSPNEPIAVVGSSCRFPGGADSPSELWELLRAPRDVLSKIPPTRFDVEKFYHPDHSFPGHSNVKHSYLLANNVAHFDAQFFHIKPVEASALDPQQRLLLETVYEGLESAGLTIEGLRGSNTGVFVGQMFGDYESLQFRDLQSVPMYHGVGTARSIMSNRISYFFDWHGPSFTVDTACSSSLVALHQAVQSLRSGEVQIAVAAGSNLILGPEPFVSESKLKMLSPDGRSKMWDSEANGYARGEGVAAVFLKTLTAALADGDNIQCIIRETGVNQDGRSQGITMPSATAQAALIRETYIKGGLDIMKDRCQYFEAHGTGTPAGDPVEAEAVYTAFFGPDAPNDKNNPSPLYVGSIKTVIGHTESTAGIAGLLKVAQAMKHGYIPPNRLLNHLNPNILPFYGNLKIPQELTAWPEPPTGQARRASVNSFGFGGTNAHAIIESFELPDMGQAASGLGSAPLSPFLFSAQSKRSLAANIKAHLEYMEHHPETGASDLSWTLRKRRSRLPLRISFPASSTEQLQTRLRELVDNFQLEPKSAASSGEELKLLGIFTGQGAQYARMGAELIESSEHIAAMLDELDESLAQLPEEDRPTITLRQELLEQAETSRVGTAAVSQPLCTALQIVLVNLLQLVGIRFATVVGHSSGEIAAAYAAGYLSASDAIRIAYYRGLHAHLASGPNNCKGAMLAVGTSQEDAEEICNDEEFKGRVKVAACNSPESVTLSGDDAAIDEIAVVFEDEGKFVRRLRVDKAYHSHHMFRCSEEYLTSIKGIWTKVPSSSSTCTWVSSVYPERDSKDMANMDASYWIDNMVSPVLFKQAVEKAISLGPFDGAVEVGPHPALRGPVRETLQSLQVELSYTGLLQRKTDAIQSISSALGYLWAQVDKIVIDFDQYESILGGATVHRFIADLPSYKWNHSSEYWHESTLSRNLRQRSHIVHPLLGDLCPASTESQFLWKHVLRPKDLPWVHGHQMQGQTVFPAAGYAVTALESALVVAGDRPIRLVEIEDIAIHQAMVLDNDNEEAGIDVQFSATHVDRNDPDCITAHFLYEGCVTKQGPFELVASGQLRITFGEQSTELLPASDANEPYMIPVLEDSLYSSLKEMGYGYSGPFRALDNIKRKLWKAAGSIAAVKDEQSDFNYTIHPALLDAAFHSIILALSYPRDGQLWSLHMPTRIGRIRVNPSLCGSYWDQHRRVPFVSSAQGISQSGGYQGDAEVHNHDGAHSAIQIEGLKVVPLTQATEDDDKQFFFGMDWVDAEPNADVAGAYVATPEETELAYILERGCCFYLSQLDKQIPDDHPGRADKFNAAYLNFAAHTNELRKKGKHRYAKKEWLNDTLEDIMASTQHISDLPEVKAMHIVGEHMPRAIRGETSMLEHLLMTGLLDEYYAKGLGMQQVTRVLADTVHQIAKRHPNLEIVEVGGGTAGATRMVLERIDREFSSYTFTDISTGFFPNAQSEFTRYQDKMKYAVLDLEQDIQSQGFKKHAYDVVVASLVVHATGSLEQTMRRVRSLLKPGGYLVMSEGTNLDLSRATALFGCLPGWWLGMGEGRDLGPSISDSDWDVLLRKVGFSGVDTMSSTETNFTYPSSVIVSQAVDDWVDFIREPLLAQSSLFASRPVINHLFLVGGSTFRNSRLSDEIQKLIGVFCENMTKVKALEELDHDEIDSSATVVVLQDLDQPVFQDLTEARFESLKNLFGSEKGIIWVTQNRLVDNPYSNMTVGFARSAAWEVPELRYQFVDFEGVSRIDSRVLTDAILRFQALRSNQEQRQRSSLSSVKPEIVIQSDGRQQISRLRPNNAANDRYNSTRRKITKEVKLQSSEVFLSINNNRYALSEQPAAMARSYDKPGETIRLRLSHSSSQAVKTSAGDAFVILGNCTSTGAQYLGLSKSLASIGDMPKANLVPCSVLSNSEAQFLGLVISNLLLPRIVGGLGNKDTLLVHDASEMMANTLRLHVGDLGIKLVCSSSSKKEATARGWLHLDQYGRQDYLKSILPSDLSRVVDFTPIDDNPSQKWTVSRCVPTYTQVFNAWSLFPNIPAHKSTDELDPTATDILSQAATASLSDIASSREESTLLGQISVKDLLGKPICEPLTVVEWNTGTLNVAIEPVKSHFRSDRTYWLVGLTGDMGLSIADWMIQSGARYLVITSRNPKIEESWLQKEEATGAVVRIIANDLTDFDALQQTYKEICQSMPPIAGVAQGAMILRDGPTRDMTLSQMTEVLNPKVQGSLNLDILFQDNPLDFFVLFSSTASVVGHVGQANYCAANMFMHGLALQRRRRGLAASVLDLGAVLGTGYISRELTDEQAKGLLARGFMPVSELDVHYAVSEAINASPLASGVEPEISTAMVRKLATEPNRPHWYSNAIYSYMTLSESETASSHSTGKEGISIGDQLANATSRDEIQTILTDSFINDLRNMLQLGDDYEVTPSIRTDELGLDSLVAVRIRSWFLNHFQVNIPALRIIKGISIQELVDQALESMPRELTPKIADLDQPTETTTTNSSSDTASENQDTPATTYPHSVNSDEATHEKKEEDVSQHITRFGDISYSQSMFYFAHKLLNDKTTMNTAGLVHFRGEIRIPDLKRAIEFIGQRHEILRTCIYERDGKVVQGVMDFSPFALEHRKIYSQQELFEEYESLRKHVYDISRGRTIRFILLSYSPRDHYLLLGYHHIIFDRTSQQGLMADLEQLYNGQQLQLEPVQYLDYSNDQRQQYLSGRWMHMVDFWRQEFKTIPETLPLHRSKISHRRPLERYSSLVKHFHIEMKMAATIRDLARKHRSTPFHLHLAAFKILLYRFLGVPDVSIAIIDNSRTDDNLRFSMGPFLNTIFLRMAASGKQKFSDAIIEARDKSIEALSNPLPLELVLKVIQGNRASTHTPPLGQAFLNYTETDLQQGESFLGCKITTMQQDPSGIPYDISLTVVNNGSDSMDVWVNLQEDLYTATDAAFLAEGYEDLLQELTEAPNLPIGDEWQFRDPALQHALTVGRGSKFESTWPQTLVHHFNEVAQTFISRVALKDAHDESWTYGHLNQRVNAIASELRKNGVQPGSRVALFQHPSVYWAASVLAILKVGAVYVPLDASNPSGRLALIVNDSQPKAILVHEPTKRLTAELNGPPGAAIIDVSQIPSQPTEEVPIIAQPNSPAIILYTSGSTGTPKGVVLQHAALKHEFDHCAATYGLGDRDVVLQQSAWSFDVSVTQIFLALTVGATLYMVPHTMRADAQGIVELIKNEGVTATYATPTEYKSWLRQENQALLKASSWKLALVAGEAVTEPLLQLFRQTAIPNHRLFNVYGPTETTCGSTKLELNYQTKGFYQDCIPVGPPSANEAFYILDSKQRLLPCGQAGEVVIAGVGVALGYLNNDERTRATFLPNPYATDEYIHNGWNTMYRTGDLGYLQQDGTLILQGRIEGDTEVKLNGVRIDLGDVEQTILKASLGALSDAVASLRVRSDGDTKFMVVHVIFSSDNSSLDKNTFLRNLLDNLPLPHMMRPSAIISVEAFPRTISGKADRNAIAALSIPIHVDSAETSALSESEATILGIWEGVLPEELLGLHRGQITGESDFFAVGGNSMLLIELQQKLKDKFNTDVTLFQLFKSSSVRGMAALMGAGDLANNNELDWAAETVLQPELDALTNSHSLQPPATPARVIVLTGSTGFLGQHILRGLLDQPQVDKVICIAIRGLGKKKSLFSRYNGVECYEGDLSLPHLGLSEEAFVNVFGVADAVIHNGADVSHLKHFNSLRASNFQSVQELVKMCLPRKIPIHFVSTTGVALHSQIESLPLASVQDTPPPANGNYGYIATKWASEAYLEKTHAAYGLPVFIHRPSSILRPEADMAGDAIVEDVMEVTLEFSRRLEAVPMAPSIDGTLDLVKPETVISKLVSAVMGQHSATDGVAYVHESGDLELTKATFEAYISEKCGKAVAELPLDEWIARAEAIGMPDSMSNTLRGLGSGEKLYFPKIVKS